ncbi:hypothetical protein ACI1US_01091 [Leucobacter sp. BZR 635]
MSELVVGVTAAVREAAERLRAAHVAPEALAVFVPERRKLLIRRKASMRPLGEVWRLGTLLVGADPGTPTLFVAGRATRSAVRPYPGNQSVSREERRDIAAAALHGGYPEGTAVNFDALPVALDEESLASLAPELPLGVVGGELRVRWRAGAPLDGAQTLAAYLAERVELLAHPPQGAS